MKSLHLLFLIFSLSLAVPTFATCIQVTFKVPGVSVTPSGGGGGGTTITVNQTNETFTLTINNITYYKQTIEFFNETSKTYENMSMYCPERTILTYSKNPFTGELTFTCTNPYLSRTTYESFFQKNLTTIIIISIPTLILLSRYNYLKTKLRRRLK